MTETPERPAEKDELDERLRLFANAWMSAAVAKSGPAISHWGDKIDEHHRSIRELFAARSGIPRTENEPPSACECLDATHPEFCHSGPAHRGWCDMYAMATDPARASVISSASPLSEEEALLVRGVRGNVEGGWDTGDEAGLLKIIDRLSASAPSPE